MKTRKFLLLTSTVIFLNGCQIFWEKMPESWNWGHMPRPLTGVRGFPETDTDYGKGFKDGCIMAWKAVSKGILQDTEKMGRMDLHVKKIGKLDFDSGWWDGFEQCTYILDWDVV